MHKEPEIKYSFALKRANGRVKPSEVRRKIRKTNERKTTRANVEALCKYMLFKNNKYVPGKMV